MDHALRSVAKVPKARIDAFCRPPGKLAKLILGFGPAPVSQPRIEEVSRTRAHNGTR
jgi:hypothetical protein